MIDLEDAARRQEAMSMGICKPRIPDSYSRPVHTLRFRRSRARYRMKVAGWSGLFTLCSVIGWYVMKAAL